MFPDNPHAIAFREIGAGLAFPPAWRLPDGLSRLALYGHGRLQSLPPLPPTLRELVLIKV